MPSTRLIWLIAFFMLVAFAFGCSSGEEAPAAEDANAAETAPDPEETAPPPEEATSPPEEESAEEAAEDLADIGSGYPVIEMSTSMGMIKLELYPDKAPRTVENFLTYVRDGFFDGTIFHRVVPGFVIQGGGFTPDMTKKETRPPIMNEADNGLRNDHYTICMARTNDPHSATSQFFINTNNNDVLNHRSKDGSGWGYAVFGKVTEGTDVIDAIEKVQTSRSGSYSDVPVDAVVIERARIGS